MYLDLVKRVVMNTIYKDHDLSTRNEYEDYDEKKRLDGSGWASKALTMIGKARLDNIEYCLKTVMITGVSGDYVEAGVLRGGASILAAAVIAESGDDRNVWLADSFEGLPAPDGRFQQDYQDIYRLWEYDYFKCSQEDVAENFRSFGLLKDNIKFLKGWYKDTLPTAPIDKISVLRLDCDLYSSTMDVLECLYDKVSSGGFIICDEYYSHPLAGQACNDFRERVGDTAPIQSIDWSGAFWRKD
jgi:hypothetical protein